MNYEINENTLAILYDGYDKTKIIELGNRRYHNYNYGISIIEIKENKNNNIKFFELDDKIYLNDSEMYYENESIYITQYMKNNTTFVSYGVMNEVNNEEIRYSCNIIDNSFFCPIFNLSNNKLIGFHKSNSKYLNKGILIKFIYKNLVMK